MRARGPGSRKPSSSLVVGALTAVAAAVVVAPVDAQVVCLPTVACPPTQTAPPTSTDPAPSPPPVTAPTGISPGDTAPQPVPVGSTSQVTSLVDPQHTSYARDRRLGARMTRAWSRTIAGRIGAVVAGDGRVFAAVGGTIRAFDAASGRHLWSIDGRRGPLAYDHGRVFATADGATGSEVVALSAEDGHELWRSFDVLGTTRSTAPVATAGRVYYGYHADDGRNTGVIARGAADGRLLWSTVGGSRPALEPTPTVIGSTVHGPFACGRAPTWSRTTGSAPASIPPVDCAERRSGAVVATGGRLVAPEDGAVLDPATGEQVRGIPRGAGVFARGLVVQAVGSPTARGTRLRATRLRTGRTVWSVGVPADRSARGGATAVRAAPVGVGASVWLVRQGSLVSMRLTDGRVTSTKRVGLRAGDVTAGTARIVPLGGGRLAVVGSRTIVTFRSAGPAGR